MNTALPLCFQRNNGKLVRLPDCPQKALATLDNLIFDGEVEGQLCTLRSPVAPHLPVGGLRNIPKFRAQARAWLGQYLPSR